VGQYKTGQQACFQVGNEALKNFLAASINNLSYNSDQQIQLHPDLQASVVVPLSDVPDVVTFSKKCAPRRAGGIIQSFKPLRFGPKP
jgi:hypothetical protein